jgi:uncharacterized protein YdeI (YjbR/CyaY-like superfamily)
MDATYFASAAEFGAWLDEHHESERELLVGYWKAGSGRPSLTWPESVDEALCFGWIDGVRRRVDDDRYTIRFTPRKPGSNWSAINLAKVETLRAAGRMRPAGEAAWARRRPEREAVYSFEQAEPARLDAEQEAAFRADAGAWAWFQAQAPSYRRTATHWVTSAKRPETRARRLATLIADSAAGRRIGPLRRA